MKYLFIILMILPLSIRGATLGVSYNSVTKDVLQTDLDQTFATVNATTSLQLNGVGVVTTARTITAGTGMSGGGDLSANRTVTWAPAAQIASFTFFDGSQASRTITYDLSGTDVVLTLSSGVFNISTGTLQFGGNTVATAANNLSFFAATTSAQFFGVISDEVGGTGTAIRVAGTASNGFVPVSNGSGTVTWTAQSGSGSGAPVGTVVNTGTPVIYALTYYLDTTGTNVGPSLLYTDVTLTNFFAGGFYIDTLVVTNTPNFNNLEVRTNLTTGFLFVTNTVDIANTDTTISRASAGDIAVEGNRIFRVGGADVPVADGGTGLSSGTSGGILYYSASGTLASSAALAANALVVGGGAGVTPATVTTGAGNLTALALAANATGGFVTDNGTATFTGKTYDAAGANNVLRQTKQLILQRPDYGDGVGAVPQTNTYTTSGLMHYTFTGGTAETNANWIAYEFDCPSDLDTTVEMTARFAFLSGGTDTSDYVFHITYDQVAPGTAYVIGTAIDLLPIVMTVTPVTPANGDFQATAAVTLTGWAAALTPGRAMQVRIAKPNDGQDDSARDVQLIITYGSTL